jgi:hypothetical protein
MHKKLISQILSTNLVTPLLVDISPPDRCGTSRSRLNSMIITQAHLVLGTIKRNTMPQMSQVLRERAIGMLTAGMSTRAVARELNANFSKNYFDCLGLAPHGCTPAQSCEIHRLVPN